MVTIIFIWTDHVLALRYLAGDMRKSFGTKHKVAIYQNGFSIYTVLFVLIHSLDPKSYISFTIYIYRTMIFYKLKFLHILSVC